MMAVRPLFAFLSLALASATYAEPAKLVVQTTHPRTFGRVALSPDHLELATADASGTVKIWAVDSGLLLRTIDLETSVRQIGFASDGHLVVAGPEVVGFYEPLTGIRTTALQIDRPLCTSFDFAGSQLVTGDTAQSVCVWNLPTGKREKVLATLPAVVRAVRVSPDGKTVAALDQDGNVTFLSVSSGKKSGTIGGFALDSNLDYSEDGKLLAGRGSDGSVRVAPVSGKKSSSSLPPTLGSDPVTFGRGADLYYMTRNGGVGRFNATNGDSVASKFNAVDPVYDFRVSPDRRFGLATRQDDSVELYSLDTEKLVQVFKGATGGVNALASSKDYALTGSDDGWIHLWNANTGRPIKSVMAHNGGVAAACFTSDNRLVSVGGDGKLQVWRLPSLSAESVTEVSHFPLRTVAISRDQKLAVIDFDGNLLSGPVGSSLTKVAELGMRARSVAFSPNGKFIAASSGDGDLMMIPASGGSPTTVPNAHTSAITFIGFSGDGKVMVTAGVDGFVKLWDSGGKKAKASIQLASSVFAGDVNPAGTVAAVGGWVQPVALIDLKSGQKVGELGEASKNIRAVSFTKDGSKLFTGGQDGSTTVWDAGKRDLIADRYAFPGRDWVIVDSKGRFDGTDKGLKDLHWVQDGKPLPLEAFFEQFYVPSLYASLTGTKVDEEPVTPPPTPKVDLTKKILPPPSVSITSPSVDQSVDSEQLTIEVSATDEGGGVDQISLFQNGKLVSTAQRELVSIPRTNGKTIQKKFAVLLAPGENVFSATAYNKDRTESASPKEVKITLNAAQAGANLYVLSVGVNDYVNDSYDLSFARPDSEAFSAQIKSLGGGIFKTVVVEQIVDKMATKANIEAAFAKIAAKAKPGDAFMFFYSGHGVVTEPDDGTQGEFYMVTSNVTKMIGSDELVKLGVSATHLKELCMGVHAQKQLIVFDACYSGGAVEAFKSRGAAEEKAIHQLSRSAGVAVLAAASPDQTATELKALGHGVFTYAILQGLNGAAAPGTGARKVTVGELFAYLNDVVPELTKQYRGKAQFPNTFLSGQDFPIVVTKG